MSYRKDMVKLKSLSLSEKANLKKANYEYRMIPSI